MSRFDNGPIYRTTSSAQIDIGLRDFMVRVFSYMAGGLGFSGLVAYLFMQSGAMPGGAMAYVILFAPLAFVLFLSSRIQTMAASTAQTMFWVYAGLMGLSIAYSLALYTTASVVNIFLTTCIVFGSMALYGYTTKKDLTSMGSFLIMGVWGIIIASLINMWLQNGMMSFFLSIAIVLVFTGLTAYDVQKIKEIYLESDCSEVATKKAIFGAITLYIDFVNIFLALLRLFGDRR